MKNLLLTGFFIFISLLIDSFVFAGGGSNLCASKSTCPTLNISVSATSITQGDTITVNWQSTNGIPCMKVVNGTKVYETSGSFTMAPNSNQYVSYFCQNSAGEGTESQSIFINVIPREITANITTNKTTYFPNDSVIVLWSSVNADACWLDGVSVPVNGTKTEPAKNSKSYYLYCTNKGGKTLTKIQSMNVQQTQPVNVIPNTKLTVSTPIIKKGQSTILTWSTSAGATNCSANWNNSSVPLSGSATVSPVSTTLYTVTCNYNNWPFPHSANIYVSVTQ